MFWQVDMAMYGSDEEQIQEPKGEPQWKRLLCKFSKLFFPLKFSVIQQSTLHWFCDQIQMVSWFELENSSVLRAERNYPKGVYTYLHRIVG